MPKQFNNGLSGEMYFEFSEKSATYFENEISTIKALQTKEKREAAKIYFYNKCFADFKLSKEAKELYGFSCDNEVNKEIMKWIDYWTR